MKPRRRAVAPATEGNYFHVPIYLSRRQLAERLSVSSVTLWRMVRRGDLPPPTRISLGRVAWAEPTIVAWLAEKGRTAA
jgi:predicted DNA-binding transcriptional regulator AlpA